MQDRTRFRLAMLDNGYWPVLNDCKRAIEKGWPNQRPDRDRILDWDRSAFQSTGMKIDGDLAVIDVDVPDERLVSQLADAMDARFPELFAHGLVRHAGGPKEAWFCRVKTPFRQLASRRWFRDGDPNRATTIEYLVECFGSRVTRQFGIDGPHKRDKAGDVLSIYAFTGNASPATVPLTSLPVLPRKAFAAACNLFDEIAKTNGLLMVPDPDLGTATVAWDLMPSMVFVSEAGVYQLDELEDAYFALLHAGSDFRVTSSFLGHGHNATKCIVGYSKAGRHIFVHDFETGITHKPVDRAPPDMVEFYEQLSRRNRNGTQHA